MCYGAVMMTTMMMGMAAQRRRIFIYYLSSSDTCIYYIWVWKWGKSLFKYLYAILLDGVVSTARCQHCNIATPYGCDILRYTNIKKCKSCGTRIFMALVVLRSNARLVKYIYIFAHAQVDNRRHRLAANIKSWVMCGFNFSCSAFDINSKYGLTL